jgi:hypothetical protein
MKRIFICGVAAAMLWAGSTVLAKDANTAKTPKQRTATEAKGTLTPAERQIEEINKEFKAEISQWEEVRKLAHEEKATKTAEKIDSIIKAKTEAHNQELAKLEKKTSPKTPAAGQPGTLDTTKGAGKPTSKK